MLDADAHRLGEVTALAIPLGEGGALSVARTGNGFSAEEASLLELAGSWARA